MDISKKCLSRLTSTLPLLRMDIFMKMADVSLYKLVKYHRYLTEYHWKKLKRGTLIFHKIPQFIVTINDPKCVIWHTHISRFSGKALVVTVTRGDSILRCLLSLFLSQFIYACDRERDCVYIYLCVISDKLRELFTKAGLVEVQNITDRRLQVNRSRQLKMYRVWIQCKYRKPAAS